MGEERQQFCLKWNNFHHNILSALEALKIEEDLVDVTISCEGRSVKAHRVILSACSPYFRKVFKENPCSHPVVILKDVRFSILVGILQFIYQGEVYVSQEHLAAFLRTAELLQIKGLADDPNIAQALASSLSPDSFSRPPHVPARISEPVLNPTGRGPRHDEPSHYGSSREAPSGVNHPLISPTQHHPPVLVPQDVVKQPGAPVHHQQPNTSTAHITNQLPHSPTTAYYGAHSYAARTSPVTPPPAHLVNSQPSSPIPTKRRKAVPRRLSTGLLPPPPTSGPRGNCYSPLSHMRQMSGSSPPSHSDVADDQRQPSPDQISEALQMRSNGRRVRDYIDGDFTVKNEPPDLQDEQGSDSEPHARTPSSRTPESRYAEAEDLTTDSDRDKRETLRDGGNENEALEMSKYDKFDEEAMYRKRRREYEQAREMFYRRERERSGAERSASPQNIRRSTSSSSLSAVLPHSSGASGSSSGLHHGGHSFLPMLAQFGMENDEQNNSIRDINNLLPPLINPNSVQLDSPTDIGLNLSHPRQKWRCMQPRVCSLCWKTFSNSFNLKQHVLNVHVQSEGIPCKLCQRTVKNKWYLRKHLVTAHGAPLKRVRTNDGRLVCLSGSGAGGPGGGSGSGGSIPEDMNDEDSGNQVDIAERREEAEKNERRSRDDEKDLDRIDRSSRADKTVDIDEDSPSPQRHDHKSMPAHNYGVDENPGGSHHSLQNNTAAVITKSPTIKHGFPLDGSKQQMRDDLRPLPPIEQALFFNEHRRRAAFAGSSHSMDPGESNEPHLMPPPPHLVDSNPLPPGVIMHSASSQISELNFHPGSRNWVMPISSVGLSLTRSDNHRMEQLKEAKEGMES